MGSVNIFGGHRLVKRRRYCKLSLEHEQSMKQQSREKKRSAADFHSRVGVGGMGVANKISGTSSQLSTLQPATDVQGGGGPGKAA